MTTEDFLRRQIIPLAYRQLPAGELMSRAATGDPEAFIALVCVKYSLVERVCRQALGPAGPAEDVAAETFLQLWRQRDKVRDPQAIDGWLTTTARNLAMKLVAAQTRGRTAGREWWQRSNETAKIEPPDRATIQDELVHRIRQAISEQSENDQRILWTAVHSGGDAQAADALGLSVSTYRVRLFRARQRLRSLLRKYGVVPVVGVLSLINSAKNRAASAVASRWTTALGKIQLLGLGLCATAVITGACWMLMRKPRPAPDQGPPIVVQPAPVETFQERNRRIVKDDLVNPLKDLLQKFYPDNPIHLVDVRAFGSEVEVEFKTERPPALETGLAERFRGRYCTFRRRYVVYAQPPASDRWYLMKPAKPLAIEVPILPLAVVIEVIAGKTEYTEAARLSTASRRT